MVTSGRTRSRTTVAVAAAGVASCALYGRAKLLGWGATDEEIAASLPGDDLIGDPSVSSTRAITVRCSPDLVWPWIAQLGQGRGGFYSYDFLENLLGFDIHSADRIVAEWQEIQLGDEVHLAATVALKVVLVEPGHALVLQGSVPIGGAPPYDSTWAFVLSEAPDGTTRLLSRERYSYKRWWARLIIEPTELVSFVMSRKMLRGIRDRAERDALSPTFLTGTSSRRSYTVSIFAKDPLTRVLVAYASKHGSTKEVAEALGRALEGPDSNISVAPAAEVHDLDEYDAVVVGGSLYVGRWHGDALRFLERHREVLVNVPLAVFALGPKTLAEAEVAASRAQLESALSKLPELEPVAVAIFGGVVDPTKLHFPLARMAASDARDWAEISAWANEVGGRFTNRVGAVS